MRQERGKEDFQLGKKKNRKVVHQIVSTLMDFSSIKKNKILKMGQICAHLSFKNFKLLSE